MIIKTDYLYEDITDKVALWVPDGGCDNSVLVRFSDVAIGNNVEKISGPAGVAARMWPWVEKNKIQLFSRFNFSQFANNNVDEMVSNFAAAVSNEFRHGAGGIQVVLSKSEFESFVTGIHPIVQDLFFNKKFSIAININETGLNDWKNVFEMVNKLNADSLLVVSDDEKFDAKSDFVGRVFAMLESWDTHAELHLMFGKNMLRVGQTIRLVEKMRPELSDKITVFVSD